MTAEPAHHWPVPPQDGYTVDDLLTLPDLPPHTELIDGSLVFGSPQREFHTTVMFLLERDLRAMAPAEFRVRREMVVLIDKHNAPEPDISVLRAGAVCSPEATYYQARDVLLAVEVISPSSESRDRDTKPHKYALAGIPHFWLVEMSAFDRRPIVHVFELDAKTRTYAPTGVYQDTLKLTSPFDIDIDLAGFDRL
ncbi:Uma2 family endonuclease [Streptomyces klenkii]|uniref:Uma2 family endonuclease n=1 Tax=Streptomyces klenkii TaxID=1420899 RepID=UPI0034418E0C